MSLNPDSFKPRDYTKLGLQVLVLVILVVASSRLFSGPFKDLVSEFSFVFRSQSLSNIVQNNLSSKEGEPASPRLASSLARGEYAIYIEDLTDGEKYTLRSSDSFPAASLYKVFLLAAVLKEVEDGRLKMEDGITANKSYLTNRLGSVDFGYEHSPENIEYSVEEALERMGRISDNFASIMLADKVGWDQVQAMADSLGATNTKIQDPITTSASDIALFFKKLYNKEVVSPSVSEKIIELLSLSKINDRLPAKLPEGIKMVHKTGELAKLRHDGGIVYVASQGDALRAYVIVLMSQNLKYEDQGVETMANISKEVYEYFQAKK